MRYSKKLDFIDVVKVPNNEYGEHPSQGWEEFPDWLQKAFEDHVIRPRFGGEDYWYYDIQSGGHTMPAAPDDYICYVVSDKGDNEWGLAAWGRKPGSLFLLKKKDLDQGWDKVIDPDTDFVPLYLPNNALASGKAFVNARGNIEIIIDEESQKQAIKAIQEKLFAVSFIHHQSEPAGQVK